MLPSVSSNTVDTSQQQDAISADIGVTPQKNIQKKGMYRRISNVAQLHLFTIALLGDVLLFLSACLVLVPLSAGTWLTGALLGYLLLAIVAVVKNPEIHISHPSLSATALRAMLPAMMVFAVGLHFNESLLKAAASALVMLMGVPVWRVSLSHFVNTSDKTKAAQEKIILVGDDKDITRFLQGIDLQFFPSRIIGYYSFRLENFAASPAVPCFGSLLGADFLRLEQSVDAVVVVSPALSNEKQCIVLRKLSAFSCPLYSCLLPLNTNTVPGVVEKNDTDFAALFRPAHVSLLRAETMGLRAQLVKRLFDVVLSSLAIVLLSPVLIVAGLAVKYSSEGAVFFRQPRWGLNGKTFHIYKFRSMYQDRCDNGKGKLIQAQQDDDRITPVGKFLRSTSIDELPQLFNVLKGDMSLIGPRPHAVGHNEYYAPKIPHYLVRHRAKPGLSGLAQVNGYRGETPQLQQMYKRISYDAAYIRRWSLMLDLKIAFQTVLLVLSRKNAH